MWTSKTCDSSHTAGVCVLPSNRMNLTGHDGFLDVHKVLGTVVLLLGPQGQQWNCQGSLPFHPSASQANVWAAEKSMVKHEWKQVERETSNHWDLLGFIFSLRIGWGCCFCKGYVWESKSEEYRAARGLFEIFSNFSEESRRACPFHWTPCEYFLIKK